MRKIPFDKVGATLYEEITDSGLRIIVAPVKNAIETLCGVIVDYGGFKHEKKIGKTSIPYGVAHFLEHRLFDTKLGNASTLFGKLGVSDNAYTTYSYTLYYFETSKDIYEPLDILLTMTTNLTFDEDSVEREKGIILSELSMYENEATEVAFNMLRKNLYFNSPLREEILGTRESIKEIHQSTLRKVFYNNYTLDKMTLLITGKVDPDEVSAYMSKVKFTTNPKKESVEPLTYTENYNSVVKELSIQEFPTDSTKVSVGIKFPPRKELFERYHDELFAIYTLLPKIVFGSGASFIDKLLQKHTILGIEDYDILEGGEDAMIYGTYMTEDEKTLIDELKSYLANIHKHFDSREFESLRKAYVGSAISAIGEPRKYFHDIVSNYANHIASPAMIDSVQLLSGRKVKKFLKDMATWPISFAVLTKEQE